MREIERFFPVAERTKSLLDRLPLVGHHREEERLAGQVLGKLMHHLENDGFTETYVSEDTHSEDGNLDAEWVLTFQAQRVMLTVTGGNRFSVILGAKTNKKEFLVDVRKLDLIVEDLVEQGKQRSLVFYGQEDQRPNEKPNLELGRRFDWTDVQPWLLNIQMAGFPMKSSDRIAFLRELLGSTVDEEATSNEYQASCNRQKLEQWSMRSVIWNRRPDALID